MKTVEKFVISVAEPTYKNVGWLKPTSEGLYTLHIFGGNGWMPVSGGMSEDDAKELTMSDRPPVGGSALIPLYYSTGTDSRPTEKTGNLLLDLNPKAVSNKWVNSTTGEEIDMEGAMYYDYMKISGPSILQFDTLYFHGGCFYDKDKNFISGFCSDQDGPVYNHCVEVPDGAVYLRYNSSVSAYLAKTSYVIDYKSYPKHIAYPYLDSVYNETLTLVESAPGYMKADGTIDTETNTGIIYKYKMPQIEVPCRVYGSMSSELPRLSSIVSVAIGKGDAFEAMYLMSFTSNYYKNMPYTYLENPKRLADRGIEIWVQGDSTARPTVKAAYSLDNAIASLQKKTQVPDSVVTLYLGDDVKKSAENIKKLDEYVSYYGLGQDNVGIPCIIRVGASQCAGFIKYDVLNSGKTGLLKSFDNTSMLIFDMDATGKIVQRSEEWYLLGPATEAAYGYVKKAAKVTSLADSATLADVITSFNSLLTAMGKANLMTT